MNASIPRNTDFIADLTYYTTEQGGRQSYAKSGIRPHVKFPFSSYLTSGQQTFLDRNIVYPGEKVKAAIKIIATEQFSQQLSEGMSFEFAEGPRTTGTGIITEIINEQLRKPS